MERTRAEDLLGRLVDVVVERPVGWVHPRFGWTYPVNYGYVPGTLSGDGEPLDVYVLGVAAPLRAFRGRAIACLRRIEEDDDKLIVVPPEADPAAFGDAEIATATEFKERFFHHRLLR